MRVLVASRVLTILLGHESIFALDEAPVPSSQVAQQASENDPLTLIQGARARRRESLVGVSLKIESTWSHSMSQVHVRSMARMPEADRKKLLERPPYECRRTYNILFFDGFLLITVHGRRPGTLGEGRGRICEFEQTIILAKDAVRGLTLEEETLPYRGVVRPVENFNYFTSEHLPALEPVLRFLSMPPYSGTGSSNVPLSPDSLPDDGYISVTGGDPDKGPLTRTDWNLNHDGLLSKRLYSSKDGVPYESITIRHRQDVEHGTWYPSTWRQVRYGYQTPVFQSAESTVTSIDLNTTVDESDFQFEFPTNTHVTDFVGNPELPDQHRYYVLANESGTRRLAPSKSRYTRDILTEFEQLQAPSPER